MKLLDKLNKIEQDIYDYFGYKKQWRVYPIDDCREMFWGIRNDEVHSWNTLEDYNDEPDSGYYINEIIINRGSNGVLKGKDYTAIIVDTQTDGNKFMSIFDNKKMVEVKEEK